ncbi:MAG: ATP-dependent zinc metalloprotease FtsH [Verrucomicrobiales bacterium]|jgi:cell division protease FtsH
MSDNNPLNSDPRESRGGGKDPNFNWRGLILLSIAMLLIAGAFLYGGKDRPQPMGYDTLLLLLEESAAVHNAVSPSGDGDPLVRESQRQIKIVADATTGEHTVEGYFLPHAFSKTKNDPNTALTSNGELGFRTTVFLPFRAAADELWAKMKLAGITPPFVQRQSVWNSPLMHFLPIFLVILLIYFFFRHQLRSAGRGAMNFGKSRAKMMEVEKNKVTFKDVAGVEEAKEEVWEIVEFLKDPKKFQRLGGNIPKGVLMVGPPGTGKTLLARAIAGEADVPFFNISGSDFVEMFVGVGASRVRDMFEQGKKNSPCLIFIDEIDAVGRHRGHGVGGGHDEREQTLNALLVEMDGFDTQEGVIIIAATNRPDVLDPALLRPGRFDRQVTVNLPDVKGREQILKVHAKKVKMAESVNLMIVARGTPGYSGAELANVINEAALLAARKGMKAITQAELEESRDKVRWGKERRSLAISEKEKEVTAYHEAGHAILMIKLENTEPLHKVTIIPRGPYMGAAMWLPAEDKYQTRKKEILDSLIVDMGGRVAEEITFGDVTSGASGDIRMATNMAKRMVCEWGMSEALGMVEYGNNDEHVFVAKDIGGRSRGYSEDTAQKIDAEIKRLIDEAYAKAKTMLTEDQDKLEAVAKALLEYETLDGKHIIEIVEHGELLNPPTNPQPPELPPKSEVTPPKPKEEEKPSIDDLPGGLTSVPAGA